jgi:hypothetical protein
MKLTFGQLERDPIEDGQRAVPPALSLDEPLTKRRDGVGRNSEGLLEVLGLSMAHSAKALCGATDQRRRLLHQED